MEIACGKWSDEVDCHARSLMQAVCARIQRKHTKHLRVDTRFQEAAVPVCPEGPEDRSWGDDEICFTDIAAKECLEYRGRPSPVAVGSRSWGAIESCSTKWGDFAYSS